MIEYSLSDLLVLTKDGEWGQSESSENSVLMRIIRGTDFAAARYGDLSNVPLRYIPGAIADRKKLQAGDLLIETAGGTKDQPTGRTVLLKQQLFESDIPITCASFSRFLRVDQTIIRPDYLFWYLQHLYKNGEMYPYHLQHTGVARFQYTQFAKNVRIKVPCLIEQKRVTELLNSLDDKIDLSRKIVDTQERLALTVFKDWFVDFGPVHSKKNGVTPPGLTSDIAALFPASFDGDEKPAGWSRESLGQFIQIFDSKRVPLSSKEREERRGPFPYYGATGVLDYVDAHLFDGVHILIGEDGSVMNENGFPFTQYVWGQFWVSNHAHVLKGLGITDEYLWCWFKNLNVAPYVTGAVQLKLNQGNLKSIPFLNPGPDLCDAFGRFAGALFEGIKLEIEGRKMLEDLRDLLMPKLMSGDFNFKEIESRLEAVV